MCPGVRVSHGELPTDPLTVGIVRQALAGSGLPGVPSPSRCAELRAAGS